jgi:hypothetical protein
VATLKAILSAIVYGAFVAALALRDAFRRRTEDATPDSEEHDF